MEISLGDILQYLVYPIIAGMSGAIVFIWNAMMKLKDDLVAIQVAISDNYVKKNDLDQKFDLIMFELRELREIMRSKADK